MMIRSATALRNDYDGMVKLSIESKSRFLTRNGDGEMVFYRLNFGRSVRQSWNCLLRCFGRAEQFAGARTYSAADMQAETEELLRES